MPVMEASEEAIGKAARAIAAGEIVAFPTETVYGLGADALDGNAVAKVFAAKDRPRFNPLIVLVGSLEEAETYAVVTDAARKLAAAFWPGPLSLVLKRRVPCAVTELVSAGLDTIALRAPGHPVTLALLAAAKRPIVAPSANRSGHISPTTAAQVEAELGERPALILDGGPSPFGVESTVVGLDGGEPALLRSGAVPREEIEAVLGARLRIAETAAPTQAANRFTLRAKLRMEAGDPRPGEALLAFGPGAPPFTGPTCNLSASGDLNEAAGNLFTALRELEATGVGVIAVMTIPEHGLGAAINDRLRRAAHAG